MYAVHVRRIQQNAAFIIGEFHFNGRKRVVVGIERVVAYPYVLRLRRIRRDCVRFQLANVC